MYTPSRSSLSPISPFFPFLPCNDDNPDDEHVASTALDGPYSPSQRPMTQDRWDESLLLLIPTPPLLSWSEALRVVFAKAGGVYSDPDSGDWNGILSLRNKHHCIISQQRGRQADTLLLQRMLQDATCLYLFGFSFCDTKDPFYEGGKCISDGPGQPNFLRPEFLEDAEGDYTELADEHHEFISGKKNGKRISNNEDSMAHGSTDSTGHNKKRVKP
ncbi:hypothetical protein C8Q74DRAFT_1434114 [Fomes fomentarius]|nr:hypothetical protein C8Q74DRAFT_1434114 [Fomes fomentarius]